MDLKSYKPMGDKENSDFFWEYLDKIYDRREASGINDLVGDMKAVAIQVEHGDAINYMAELHAMGPYRMTDARLTETHKVFLLQSRPEFPRMLVLEPLNPAFEDWVTRWNLLYPLAKRKPNARYIGEIYATPSVEDIRVTLEPQNIRFVYEGDTVSDFYVGEHLTFTFLSDYTYNRVGYADVDWFRVE